MAAALRRGRGEPRLDPVRWRPGRAGLIRLAMVAALLVTAAGALWMRPAGCAAVPGAAGPPTAGGTAVPSATTVPRGPVVPRGSVGVPVRLAEPAALALVRPGDRVDLLSVNPDAEGRAPVAAAALVLGVTGADDPTAGGLLLALKPAEAAKAVTSAGHGFAVVIRPD